MTLEYASPSQGRPLARAAIWVARLFGSFWLLLTLYYVYSYSSIGTGWSSIGMGTIIYLLVCASLSALFWIIAWFLSAWSSSSPAPAALPVATTAAPGDKEEDSVAPAIASLQTAIDRLAGQVSALAEAPRGNAARPAPAVSVESDESAEAWPRVIELLEEIRELSMMSDAQRKARFLHHAERRKTLLLRQATNCIGAAHFADAEKAIEQCAASYTNDEDVKRIRQQLESARGQAAVTAVENAQAQITDLMAISRWDQAMVVADRLAADYPNTPEAQSLHDHVARERDVFRNAACQRLYEEIKQDIEHRDWRRALAGTQKLLEQFGDLPRAEKIRHTVHTIQDNAEIEERQEMEGRIQDLIRSGHFSDAIDLSDELIARFPESLQADKLRDMLPKLREKAIQHEAADFFNSQ